ncbi:hypothetical protein U879_03345 [Defluviimonas sp. 20V17]|nr:AAA family ATPase [Allgaiera indica]KDB05087.1 hypothetical protein U879_03345 [Defluviimonas sp. 20V17]SDX56190.1 Peptidase family M41 [Allgaiera indica]
MTQAYAPRPAWRTLADLALNRLRLRSATGTPAFPFAPLEAGKSGGVGSGIESLRDDLDVFEDEVEASGKTVKARPLPLPPALTPFRLRPDPRHLQALLRLAFALGSTAAWEACLEPHRLTLIEAGQTWLLTPLQDVITGGFAGDLRVVHRARQLGALGLHEVLPSRRGGRLEKDPATARDIAQLLEDIAANPTPAIGLVTDAGLLTEEQRAMFDHHLVLPPLSREILIAHLAESHRGTVPADALAFRTTLPSDEVLAQQDILGLINGLRAPTAPEVAARLPHALPPEEKVEAPRPRVSPGPTLAELPIPVDLKEMLTGVSADLLAWKAGDLAWSEISRGVLLVGPPGVGKTETGRALARGADLTFVDCSLSAGLGRDKHLGESLGRIQAAIDRAKAEAPSILFLDELDAVGDRANSLGHNSGYERRFITALNEMLDGFEGREGVFVIGTANHPEQIDRALMRAGRFDRVMRIALPDRKALTQILRLHLGESLSGADLDRLAADAVGSSGADVAAAIRTARGLARSRQEAFAETHLAEVIGARRRQELSALTRRMAIHEAGHAIVANLLEHPNPIRIAFTAEGAETTYATDDNLGTKAARDARLAALMAGRAAELLMLGEIAEGSGGSAMSDLAQATLISLREELSFGLGAAGALWFADVPDPAVWLVRDPQLRVRVEDRLAEASRAAREILASRQEVITQLADTLVAQRELKGEVLRELLLQKETCVRRIGHGPDAESTAVGLYVPATGGG